MSTGPSTLGPVWRSLEDVPDDLGPTVVSIGNFDGVHRGHCVVLSQAARHAAGADLPVVAVIFDPHPMAVLRPDHAPSVLTPPEQRAELLRSHGVDHVLALPFDRAMAAWSPTEFVDRVLVEALHARVVVVGANFRFGARAAGDLAVLQSQGAAQGEGRAFTAHGVDLDGGPQVWSSTYVRTCLAAGDVAGAAEALGRPFAVQGPVARGDQRGRDLGYPTANVELAPDAAVPADGVYAGHLVVRGAGPGQAHPAAISVGTNPTFEGVRARRVEAYVLDRDDLDLYGTVVEVTFEHRLRGMATFTSPEELRGADGARRRRRPRAAGPLRWSVAGAAPASPTRSPRPTPGSSPTA